MDAFTAPDNCNYCCSPGYVGCHMSDGTYGCFLSGQPLLLIACLPHSCLIFSLTGLHVHGRWGLLLTDLSTIIAC